METIFGKALGLVGWALAALGSLLLGLLGWVGLRELGHVDKLREDVKRIDREKADKTDLKELMQIVRKSAEEQSKAIAGLNTAVVRLETVLDERGKSDAA